MDQRLAAICQKHGAFLRWEAEQLGYDDHAIARLARRGVWVRVRHGAYTLRVLWDGLTDNERYALRCRAACRQAKTRVALSHRSSSNEWHTPMWEIDLATVDLTRADGRTGRAAVGVRQHRGKLEPGDWQSANGVDLMSPTRTALELTTLLDVEHSLVEIDNLLHQGLTTLEDLHSRFATMNRWPDTLHTDFVLRLVDGRSESVGETRVRYLCWAQHLPAPEVNYAIRDRTGRVVARVDLAWPSLGVFLEFDGQDKYLRYRRAGETIAQCVERERRREHLVCELTGWRCIRLVWADLYRPRETADRIRALFRSVAA